MFIECYYENTYPIFIFMKITTGYYRSGTINSIMVNSKFHFIQSFCDIYVKCFPMISCLKCTVNSNFHLIRSKILPKIDFELTVQLYADHHRCANE